MDKNDLDVLVKKNHSQRELAEILGVSHTTIRYWLNRYGLKTTAKNRHEGKGKYIQSTCKNHSETEFIFIHIY